MYTLNQICNGAFAMKVSQTEEVQGVGGSAFLSD